MRMTRVTIVGAGPVGLDAALAAREAGHDVTVYEAAPNPAGHVRAWQHVRLFTPWSWNVSPRMARLLGDDAPSGKALPTGADLADALLDPVADAVGVQTGVRVVEIGRAGLLKHEEIGTATRAARPFRLRLAAADGHERMAEADVIIDASGVYGTPNRLGDGGLEALGERACADLIIRKIPEPGALSGATVLLTGAGHSAQTAARDLAATTGRVIWAVRARAPTWGVVDDDPLAERAALHASSARLAARGAGGVEVRTGHSVEALRRDGDGLVVTLAGPGGAYEVRVDRVVALHGGAPDATLYRQLQMHECYATLGPMKLAATLLGAAGGDCLSAADAGSEAVIDNPEPSFFVLGAKSYGRNSQFLLRVGWAQVDAVFGHHLRATAPATALASPIAPTISA